MSPELSTWSSNFASIDANAHLQAVRRGILWLTPLIESRQSYLHIQCGSNGAIRIILMRDRLSKHCHYRVTYIFLNCATMPPYLLCHEIEVPCQDGPQILGIKFICKGC